MRNIILLAPPASGKGTQASLLRNNFNLCHISTGDLLRNAASRNDDMGLKLNEIMSSGALVSDDIVLELLKREIANNNDREGFIFDGFPRNTTQAESLDELLKELGMKIDYVFLLNADYDTLLSRITGRRTCKTCGRIYNLNGDNRPSIDTICDICGDTLSRRKDDNPDSFKVRYQEYLDKTYPLINYYKNMDKLIEIDALQNVEDVYKEIETILNK